MLGVVAQAKAVTQRMGSLVKLHLELAKLEAKKKATRLGEGVGLGGLALVLALYAIGFGFTAAAIGVNEVLPLWASLLIVAGALLLAAAITVFLAVRYLRELSHPLPEQALAEMERTIETLERHA
jgi:uncharacterized membrane protein YqjE